MDIDTRRNSPLVSLLEPEDDRSNSFFALKDGWPVSSVRLHFLTLEASLPVIDEVRAWAAWRHVEKKQRAYDPVHNVHVLRNS